MNYITNTSNLLSQVLIDVKEKGGGGKLDNVLILFLKFS